jgi:hypothetical protein
VIAQDKGRGMADATVRIGCGAGYAGDRYDTGVKLAEVGRLDYLVLECLAERTMGLAQHERRDDPHAGYGSSLPRRMRDLLPYCGRQRRKRMRLVTNLGAANPGGALEETVRIAKELGLRGLRIGAVEGDRVLELLPHLDRTVLETGQRVGDVLGEVEWAHAYIGVEAMLPALEDDCDVVLTGRAADPSLFLAAMVHEHGWGLDDWVHLGRGTAAAHLLECGSSVTGGYFAEPGVKDVPNIEHIGMPIVEIDADGNGIISKTPGSGGVVSVASCREQMLYEIHDPTSYLTPDVTADFSTVTLTAAGQDEVSLRDATGRQRPDELKVILGMPQGWIGEGEMSYGGPNALARAELAVDIVRYRLCEVHGFDESDLHVEIIGYDAMLGPIGRRITSHEPLDVRLRVAARAREEKQAKMVGHEVEALTVSGPGGGGGKRSRVHRSVAVRSTTIPRELVKTAIHVEEI